MREAFLNKLDKRVIVCDGAMGTMLFAKGIPLSRCFDELNLSEPQRVKEVHLGYVKAGAELIETNTFGATRPRLEKYGLASRVREVNLAGARLAREVAGDELYVAGSVGPLGLRLEPLGSTRRAEARAFFREQMEALVEGGVDLIIAETMTDLGEAREALLAAREICQLPVIIQMTIQEDGSTPTGAHPEDLARQLDAWGADVIGINCGVGPAAVLEALERMARVTSRKLSAQPNAGLPRTIDGRNIYLSSPEYMAGYAKRFIEAGARLLGGCCGTTPEHIRALKAAVRSLAPAQARSSVAVVPREVKALEPVAVEKRSRLAEKLYRNQFPILVEILPPKGADPTRELEGAQYLASHGIDGVNIPDGAGSSARMSALTLAALLQQRVAIEVLLHYSARDRSVLAIQSDFLGAHALGLRNVLALTRDRGQLSTALEAGVFEVDAVGIANILSNLNRGLDVGGNPLGTQTGFLVGVSLNPCAVDVEKELLRYRLKLEAGADFAVTQPVFNVEQFARFLDRASEGGAQRVPVIASVVPLTSYRNAEFMNNEVPGVSVPPAIMERMKRADTGDAARAEGLRIAQETLLALRGIVEGVQITAPFGRYAMAVEAAAVLTGNG
jgi:homocysteine S-methyltransferase